MKIFLYTYRVLSPFLRGQDFPYFSVFFSGWRSLSIQSFQTKSVFLIISFFLVTSCSWKNKWVKGKIEKEEDSKKAYILGYKLGDNAKTLFSKEEDQKIFLIGVYHSIKNKKPLVGVNVIEQKKTGKLRSARKPEEEGKNNMEQGKVFLEANSKKTDVKTTPSGLQYKVLKEGAGDSPSAADSVEVHYRGTLIDGTEFDSSYKRNQTITFPLNGVIAGWTEGLQLMKEGAKYEFYIPAELAYGSSGTGRIPPNSVLIFEVELIKVNP
ncbi:MAG: FKBP-type peptidyl-prolyl cis-trans isomerase [Bdellovibrionales bacterium]|nr:FKBP-type peptidyl-prolyl cis-trans isomerase [Bdellovibrionales bacterium]